MLIFIVFGCCFAVLVYFIISSFNRNKNLTQNIDSTHINENSFQRYAKFYGKIIPSDDSFNMKINSIYHLIKNNNMTDINKIAELSSCSTTECVLKIRYLKNKRLLDDLYIDTVNMKLLPCSSLDQQLLDKYKPYIYGAHSQISDFVNLIPNPEHLSIKQLKNKILEELKYLDDKQLLNGVMLDGIDGEIIYYALEKRKNVKNMETIHCPNCGALNDVELTGKVRCSYCNSIIMGSKFNQIN